MSKDSFDKWESATNTLKNIFFILGAVAVIFLLVLLFPQLKAQVTLSKLESVEFAGVKLKLYNDLNTPDRVRGGADTKIVGPVVKNAALIINTEEASWVYLGATSPKSNRENWLYKFFDITVIPTGNDIIQASTDIFKRSDKPRMVDGNWLKGDIQGLIKQGQKVRVINVVEIPGDQTSSLWWAKVQSP